MLSRLMPRERNGVVNRHDAIQDTGYWILVAGYRLQRYRLQVADAGYWILDTGLWILVLVSALPSLFTIHDSRLATHHSPLTIHHSRFTSLLNLIKKRNHELQYFLLIEVVLPVVLQILDWEFGIDCTLSF
ncbi:MAG TPA: hypothetical protein VEV87_03400 [Chitinophagaceae bacterium]|nr:hypothetical protein [Chitinophagaceae bacterium]